MCTSCASCMLVSDALCAYSGQWVRGGAAAAASRDCGSGMLQAVVVAEMLAWAHLQARAASRHVCHNSSSGVYAQAPTASCSEECVGPYSSEACGRSAGSRWQGRLGRAGQYVMGMLVNCL